jgi:ABC-2 type transport system permease protein
MLRLLVAKDLRRFWRNPLPWAINLIIPLAITALIGLAFGGRSDRGALGRIRFAVVDEDGSLLTRFLHGAANQQESSQYLEPVFLDRAAALRQVAENKVSAVVIIPARFTRDYLTGRETVGLELVKNPAQSIHPTVIEELLGVVVTALNTLARNFRPEFAGWDRLAQGEADYHELAAAIERVGRRLEAARRYINPPLIGYERMERVSPAKGGVAFNLFAYLLAGLAAMFLLFLAGNAMIDLHREARHRTLARYHTVRNTLFPFVAGKVMLTVVMLLLCSAIMFGGGALLFRIRWPSPFALLSLDLGYACFAAGLLALLVALVPEERHAGVLNTLAGMALGLAGGCAFPPQQLPPLLRDHLSPLLPTYWFAESLRALGSGGAGVPWVQVSLKLAGAGLILTALAAWRFRKRFKGGLP